MSTTQPSFILATHNAHKLAELRAIIAATVPGFTATRLASAAAYDLAEPVEDGASFVENAEIKARYVAAQTGIPALADDSGLSVDILGGAPGIFSARWCGHHGDDRANLQLLIDQLADVRPDQRGAAFVCAAVLALPSGETVHCVGQLRGTLRERAVGSGGFGYDPIFQPVGMDVTLAELAAAEKNKISHRCQAFTALAQTELFQQLAR